MVTGKKAAIPSQQCTRRYRFSQTDDRDGDGKNKVVATSGTDETWLIVVSDELNEVPETIG